MTVDSMLCRFKSHYESVRIDSVRHLLEDKEKRLWKLTLELPTI